MKRSHSIHFVAFIDILGFQTLIDEHFSGSNVHSLKFLKQALKHARSYAVGYTKGYLKQFNLRFSFKQFSDCVSISMPSEQGNDFDFVNMSGIFVNVVRVYQLILLDNNILCRGGIAIGPHIENRDMIFSKAIVKAYQIESKKAIYPRIIIDKGVLDRLTETLQKDQEKYIDFINLFATTFVKDWDDEVFISPFGLLNQLKMYEIHFGKGTVKNLIDPALKIKNHKDEIPSDFLDTIHEEDNINSIYHFVINYLANNQEGNPEVLLKYKWLQEFILWTSDPEKSKIKFEYCLSVSGIK